MKLRKPKEPMIKIMFVLTLIFVTSGCNIKDKNDNLPFISFQKEAFEINYGRQYFDLLSNEFIKEKNGVIEVISPALDTSTSGSQKLVYRVYDENKPDVYKDYEIQFIVLEEKFVAYPLQWETYYFTCDNWITNKFDSRILLKDPETGGNSNRLHILLEGEETKTIRILGGVGTELGSWIEGTYEYLGDKAYLFNVNKVYVNDYQDPEGPILSNFYRDGKNLYYLGESNDFQNYQQYPYCILEAIK